MSRAITSATLFSVLILSGVSGCNRDQDQTTPVGQQPQGRSTAQDYPSTRNTEQPNPAVGGNNSATNNQAPPAASKEPQAGSASR